MTETEIDFSGSVAEWVAALPPYQQTTVSAMLNTSEAPQVIQAWLESAGAEHTAPLGAIRNSAQLFYDRLLDELQTLVCTNDSYVSERQQFLQQAQAGKATLIAGVTAAIAPQVGAAAALVGPPLALTLALVGRASRAATCEALTNLVAERAAAAQTRSDAEDGASAPPAGSVGGAGALTD